MQSGRWIQRSMLYERGFSKLIHILQLSSPMVIEYEKKEFWSTVKVNWNFGKKNVCNLCPASGPHRDIFKIQIVTRSDNGDEEMKLFYKKHLLVSVSTHDESFKAIKEVILVFGVSLMNARTAYFYGKFDDDDSTLLYIYVAELPPAQNW